MSALDPEQQRFLDRRFAEWLEERPNAVKLKEILLRIAGQAVVAPPNNYEPDLEALTAARAAIHGDPEVICMEDNACHVNAAILWRNAARPDFGIGTGFGLNRGLWRQHTWAMDDARIIETTEPAKSTSASSTTPRMLKLSAILCASSRLLLLRLQHQLLHAPVQQLSDEQDVLARAGHLVDPAELAGLLAGLAQHAEHLAVEA
jgi:hypothetical protein